MWLDLDVSELGSMSRDELIVLARDQASRLDEQDAVIARQDTRITTLATQLADVLDRFEQTAAKLARLEHLLSRNSSNSSFPSSKDDDPGRTPPRRERRAKPVGRAKGKQKGGKGATLRWCDDPDEQRDRFPQGSCPCSADLAEAADLGVVDRYQQHEIPLVSVKVTQDDQHAVACRCGSVHTAKRPEGAGAGRIEYGLQAFAVYLRVMHFVPVHRCRELLESLTGAKPSVGFVHSLLSATATVPAAVDRTIRTLITLAYAICCDETPLKVGPATAAAGKTQAKGYLLVACTEAYTHYLLGDRSLDTFKAFVFPELHAGAVIVHDRYQNYDSTRLGDLTHQLCTAHLLRDLEAAGEVCPKAVWPTQIADALRELTHRANTARDAGAEAINPGALARLREAFRHGVLLGLADTLHPGDRPGERTARLLLQALRDREADVLRFASDLQVPPTSNQAERDLRLSKIQEKISGRLPERARAKDRYLIRGVLSTVVKHGHDALAVLRDAFCGRLWFPPAAAALP